MIFITLLYVVFVMGFRFRRQDFKVDREKESFLDMFLRVEGWQAVVGMIVFIIVYGFLEKKSVLVLTLNLCGIEICE